MEKCWCCCRGAAVLVAAVRVRTSITACVDTECSEPGLFWFGARCCQSLGTTKWHNTKSKQRIAIISHAYRKAVLGQTAACVVDCRVTVAKAADCK